MKAENEIRDQILVALRRIMRAVDLHSRRLVQSCGLTGPQVLILKELLRSGPAHVSELADAVSLSQATVTDILNRLERRGLIHRTRSISDKRRVQVSVTEAAEDLLRNSPPLLQEQFSAELEKLQDWEQTQLLATLQRIAAMMNAKQIDASPVFSTGAVNAAPELIEVVTETTSKEVGPPAETSVSGEEEPRPGAGAALTAEGGS